jgi:hypothetical protein
VARDAVSLYAKATLPIPDIRSAKFVSNTAGVDRSLCHTDQGVGSSVRGVDAASGRLTSASMHSGRWSHRDPSKDTVTVGAVQASRMITREPLVRFPSFGCVVTLSTAALATRTVGSIASACVGLKPYRKSYATLTRSSITTRVSDRQPGTLHPTNDRT